MNSKMPPAATWRSVDTISQLPDLPRRLLYAPQTECDPDGTTLPGVPTNTVRYIYRHAYGKPWYLHIVVCALILAAERYDSASIYNIVALICGKLNLLFNTLSLRNNLKDMSSFFSQIDECMRLYLSGTVGQDSSDNRILFFSRYQLAAKLGMSWLRKLPSAERRQYHDLLFQPANRSLLTPWLDYQSIADERHRRRKEDTDGLMEIYPEIRTEAHMRWNWFNRFRQAYHNSLKAASGISENSTPFSYSYVDQELRLELNIWSSKQLIDKYHDLTQCNNIKMIPPPESRFVEIVDIVSTADGKSLDIDQTLWFAEVIRYGPVSNANAKAWRTAWGYVKNSFTTNRPGLLNSSYKYFLSEASARTGHLIVSVDDIFLALTFGLLAVELFTTTGARLNEVMQVSLSKDCLVRLIRPPPAGSEDPRPRVRYLLRLIPKGERQDIRHDFFLGDESKRLIARVAQIVADHYGLRDGQALPVVSFAQSHPRAHRFKPEPYLLQLDHKHISGIAVSSCMRLILHGMIVKNSSGHTVSVRPHLLRHGFATHAVQVEKLPVDIVGAWLHQKHIPVTQYYSRLTETMIADAADRYLSAIARNIDVERAVLRSPREIKELYEDALSTTGTLADVVGGDCGSHGLCKVQFACVGCAAKIPDPKKRSQVEHRRIWAIKQIPFYEKQGLLPEVRRLQKLVSAADLEMREMDLIEHYRADELIPPKNETYHAIESTHMVDTDSPATPHANARTRSTRNRTSKT